MKKIIAILILICLFLFNSCKQEDLINIDIFAKRFNKISSENIDVKNLKAIEENENLYFNFLLLQKYLLTVTSDKNSNRIKSCSITVKKQDFNKENFALLCKNVSVSFQKIASKDFEKILEKFNFNDTLFLKEGFYYYYFSKNDSIYYFNIESSRLVEEYITDLKLYE